ncbi:hypothetical protein [Bizionia echini]|uniref:hypothetical protein n=1 Tax=Bizionia echini TaxID=649333 RepID=UPI0030D72E55
MKPFLSVLLLLMSTFSMVHAQEKYRVIYDYNTEEINYYHLDKYNKVDDTLLKPKFKRNSLVELKLKNVNPFAMDIQADVKEEAIHSESGGFNFSSLLGGISSFSGGDLGLNVDNLPIDESMFSQKVASRGAGVSNKFSDLNKLSSNIDAIKSTLMSNLLNPNLDKEAILANVKNAANKVSDSRVSDPEDNFYVFLSSMKRVVQEDSQELASELNALATDINEQEVSNTELSRGELVAHNNAYTNLKNMLKSLNASSINSSENLNKIEELYATLEASSFEQTYDYLIEADKVNIELKFVQSEFSKTSNVENSQSTLKTRNLKLFSKGGFKINTSVALTLNNFGDSSKDFYIDENGVIGADVNDYFVPNLSTMINFYPVIGENFNIGGSFGLSIPITEDLKGINFLLGPSLFFGSKSRLALSGGIAYGPVNQLTNGLEVDQTTDIIDIDNFTKNVYDFGYYFGISFSLFDLN